MKEEEKKIRIKCPIILSAFRTNDKSPDHICHFDFSLINLFDEFRRPSIPYYPKPVNYYNITDILKDLDADIDSIDKQTLIQYGQFLTNEVIPNEIVSYLHELEKEYAIQLLFITNDNFIPWEIVCDDYGFWATRYPIGRIYGTSTRGRSMGILTKGRDRKEEKIPVLLIYDPEGNLEEARREGEELSKKLNKSFSIETLTREVSAGKMGFAIGSNKHDIIHFAGHADLGKQNGLRGFGGTIMGRETIQDYKLSRHPIVFANACSTATNNYYGASSDSIATAFIKAGASAFIGTLWRINDVTSARFASEFYYQILCGRTIGDAMLQTKKNLDEKKGTNDIDWIAFTLFGNPDGRLFTAAPKGDLEIRILQIMMSNNRGTLGKVLLQLSKLGINIVQGRSITFDDEKTAGYIAEIEAPKELDEHTLSDHLSELKSEGLIYKVSFT